MPKKFSTITIAVDGNEANIAMRVGSNWYAFEILKALEKITRQKNRFNWIICLANQPLSDMPSERTGWQYKVLKPQKFWTQWAFPWHLFWHAHQYHVVFCPGHYAPRFSAVPYVSSVMDVAYLLFPEQFRQSDRIQLKNWTAYSVRNARKVIAISQATKQDVIAHYQKSPEDVVVAYPAVNEVKKSAVDDTIFTKLRLHEPYFLYVGTIQPRKNLINLITAYEQCLRMITANPPRYRKVGLPKLVLAGKTGWLADSILDRIATSPAQKNIILTGYITESEKVQLYQKAEALVLIGLYEGFGLPALEAMTCDTLPIVSNVSSLPEVVGEAGFQVDPHDVNDIAHKLYEVITMSVRQRAIERKLIRQQVLRFNWENSARVVLNALKQVARHDQ